MTKKGGENRNFVKTQLFRRRGGESGENMCLATAPACAPANYANTRTLRADKSTPLPLPPSSLPHYNFHFLFLFFLSLSSQKSTHTTSPNPPLLS